MLLATALRRNACRSNTNAKDQTHALNTRASKTEHQTADIAIGPTRPPPTRNPPLNLPRKSTLKALASRLRGCCDQPPMGISFGVLPRPPPPRPRPPPRPPTLAFGAATAAGAPKVAFGSPSESSSSAQGARSRGQSAGRTGHQAEAIAASRLNLSRPMHRC